MGWGKQQSTETCTVYFVDGSEYTEEGGNAGRGLRIGPCTTPEQGSRGENARPVRSVRTEILKANPRKGDGRGTNVSPLHPPRRGIAHQSDLLISSKYLPTCVPNPHLLPRSHPHRSKSTPPLIQRWPVSRKTSGSLQEMAIWTESRLVMWFPVDFFPIE